MKALSTTTMCDVVVCGRTRLKQKSPTNENQIDSNEQYHKEQWNRQCDISIWKEGLNRMRHRNERLQQERVSEFSLFF
jgi:hypothetical protein